MSGGLAGSSSRSCLRPTPHPAFELTANRQEVVEAVWQTLREETRQ